jgi:hypothetical protein
VYIGYPKYVASISNHVKIGSVTCLFWLPQLENRGSQNSSEQSCDSLLSVPKIRSTPNSKWSSLLWNSIKPKSYRGLKMSYFGYILLQQNLAIFYNSKKLGGGVHIHIFVFCPTDFFWKRYRLFLNIFYFKF